MTFIDPPVKLYGHLDRLHQLRERQTEAPINVEIDLSNRCSLGCEWCHFAYTHTRGPLTGTPKPLEAIPGGDLMDTDLALSIIDQFAQAGVRSVTWTGGGEPTLHPDFNQIIAYTPIPQGLYTHGGHITEARAALLKQTLTFAYVSLDAANATAYKRDKGVDRFQVACDGIELLAKAEGSATVGVGFLVTKKNWRDAEAATRLALDLGADYIQFRPTILYEQETPDAPNENTGWLGDALETLETVAKRYGQVVLLDRDRFRMYQTWAGHGYEDCWWSGLQTCVTPNGKVWTCVNKREHHGAQIGDLSTETFTAIWRRHRIAKVTGDCRVMCRGHIPNVALNEILTDRPHKAFV